MTCKKKEIKQRFIDLIKKRNENNATHFVLGGGINTF